MNTSKKPRRIHGLDTIRFIAAAVVVFGHFGIPLPTWLGENAEGVFRVLRGLIGCSFNGPAAVIVFFVVSGFCIHYPQSTGGCLHVPSYLTRRLVRIVIPAIIAAYWMTKVGVELRPTSYGVFWSVICEVIYYLLYPILLWFARRFSWGALVAISTLVCVFLWWWNAEVIRDSFGSYISFGHWTWVNGLPCWLLGCWVADKPLEHSGRFFLKLGLLRAAVIVVSIVLRIAQFHAHSFFASNCITLNLFAFLVACWLRYETSDYKGTNSEPFFDRFGQWSYSIYLVHPIVPSMLSLMFAASTHREFGSWIMIVLTSFALAYIFYLIVERPSHLLAQCLGRRRMTLQ